MNHAKKMQKMREVFDRCIKIADAKGRDYSGEKDGFGNLKDFGVLGIVCRIGDKYHRAKNIVKTGNIAVTEESLADTLLDTINYAALAIVMMEEINDDI